MFGFRKPTQHQQHAAEDDRLAHAEVTVGQQAADDRDRVDQPAVGADDVVAGVVAEQVVLG